MVERQGEAGSYPEVKKARGLAGAGRLRLGR